MPEIHHTVTGYAARSKNREIRRTLMENATRLGRRLAAERVEAPITSFNYVVPGCPEVLSNVFGESLEVADEIEAEVVCYRKPGSCVPWLSVR